MAIYEERESYATSRAGGIGGTDAAAILGLSPWKRPIDVYEGKLYPERIAELDKECLFWGIALEPIIRARFSMQYGVDVLAPPDIASVFPNSRPWNDSTLIIGQEPWMLGAPDGWIASYRRGLEIKCSARKSEEWGPAESGEVPAGYFVQSSWYMFVSEAESWDFGVLFSGTKLERFHIPRDREFEKDMVEACRAFRHDYVLKQVEPPIDESENYGRYLARKYSLASGKVINDPTPEMLEWTAKMKLADDQCKEAEAQKQLANNHLRFLVADADKAITPLGTVGWIRPKKKMEVNIEAAANELARLYDAARAADALSSAQVIAANSSPKQNDPYLRAWWKK